MYKIRVYHDYYGDSGCCGHTVSLEDEQGKEMKRFEFAHPYGDDQQSRARRLAERVIDEYWPECLPKSI